ncbi:hypothetical protein E2C01_086569 [Portunus trituberculatus]|uniref:Uncharacterized protein n=1 Tax=Portunus trituberculatus TaxID=210409 RepID=A0A5B7JBT6_PORTR|nr:hypothetical protein [Portunus trituberculatus]
MLLRQSDEVSTLQAYASLNHSVLHYTLKADKPKLSPLAWTRTQTQPNKLRNFVKCWRGGRST